MIRCQPPVEVKTQWKSQREAFSPQRSVVHPEKLKAEG
jgi:hypothetical protein